MQTCYIFYFFLLIKFHPQICLEYFKLVPVIKDVFLPCFEWDGTQDNEVSGTSLLTVLGSLTPDLALTKSDIFFIINYEYKDAGGQLTLSDDIQKKGRLNGKKCWNQDCVIMHHVCWFKNKEEN